jgi:hypothetical protein
MSQENVEVVRRAIESYESDEEAWLGTLDPEIVWYPVEESHSPSRGRDSARQTRERWLETFDRESYRHEIEELRGKGEDIVAVVCVRARGRGSGIEIARTAPTRIGKCITAGSSTSTSMRLARKPSKPRGSRSRRCRRSTPRSLGGLDSARSR